MEVQKVEHLLLSAYAMPIWDSGLTLQTRIVLMYVLGLQIHSFRPDMRYLRTCGMPM